MIIKKNILTLLLSGASLLLWLFPMSSSARSTADNPLQYYDNQIKQAQQDALQALSESRAGKEQNPASSSSKALPLPPTATFPAVPHSNTDKAFTPSSPKTRNQAPAPSSSGAAPQSANPWLKPNPWAKQGQHNPWANAPIPSPTPPPPATSGFTPPPNIFAPPQATSTHPPSANHG